MDSARGKHKIKVGCCGFAAAQKKYFELFKVIEIQQTFYQLPEIKTAETWRRAAPPGFEFTMKEDTLRFLKFIEGEADMAGGAYS